MLLRKILPHPAIALPTLLTPEQFTEAKEAMINAQDNHNLKKTDFIDILEAVNVDASPKFQRESKRAFENCVTQYRMELMKDAKRDPFERFQVHQAVMASGYYERLLNPLRTPEELHLFLANQYNHDCRIDPYVPNEMDKIFLEENSTYNNANHLISDILIAERHLFGPNRLFTVNNKQNLMLGIDFRDIKDHEHWDRILSHPSVKRDGNFETKIVDVEEGLFWRLQSVQCLPEEEGKVAFHTHHTRWTRHNKIDYYDHKIAVPKILTRKERITNFLLRAWVGWLTLWLMFWAVDEEIITLVALLIAKFKNIRNLEKLAEDAGGSKIYVAHKFNPYSGRTYFNLY